MASKPILPEVIRGAAAGTLESAEAWAERITNGTAVWGTTLSARERLQCRLCERRKWQQEEMPPVPLEDIDDTCEVFWTIRMLRRLRCSSRSLPVALRKVIQGGWI